MNEDITKKVHPEAKLKALTEERQAEIAEFAETHTLAETVQWLAQAGVQVSLATVSRFLSFHRLTEQVARNAAVIQTMFTDGLGEETPPSPERLAEISMAFFTASALERQDIKAWSLTQQIAIKNARLQLEIQKYNDLVAAKKKADQPQPLNAARGKGLSPETLAQIERELNLL